MVHFQYIHLIQIIQYNKICLITWCDCSKMMQAIAFCCLYGRHFDCLFRLQPEPHCLSYIEINMSFPADLLNVLVICTETEAGSIRVMLYNAFDNRFQVLRCTSFTDQYLYPISEFFHRILVSYTFMICRNSCQCVCCQIF